MAAFQARSANWFGTWIVWHLLKSIPTKSPTSSGITTGSARFSNTVRLNSPPPLPGQDTKLDVISFSEKSNRIRIVKRYPFYNKIDGIKIKFLTMLFKHSLHFTHRFLNRFYLIRNIREIFYHLINSNWLSIQSFY